MEKFQSMFRFRDHIFFYFSFRKFCIWGVFFLFATAIKGQPSLEEEKTLSPVTVRVWDNGLYLNDSDKIRVGHVSIDTGKNYISLWPDNWEKNPNRIMGHIDVSSIFRKGFGIIADFIIKRIKEDVIISDAGGNSIMGDLEGNKRAPDQVFQILLDSRKIDKFWKELCKDATIQNEEGNYYDKIIGFKNLSWYVGGDPAKHSLIHSKRGPKYIYGKIDQGKCYSCAGFVLKALMVGGVCEHGDVSEKFISEMIPAIKQPWYKEVFSSLTYKTGKILPFIEELLLSKNLLSTPITRISCFNDDTLLYFEGRLPGHLLFSLSKKVPSIKVPNGLFLSEASINEMYITPSKIGELMQVCSFNQLRKKLISSLEETPITEKSIEKSVQSVLINHYPHKEKIDKLRNYSTKNKNDDLQDSIKSYIHAYGRSFNDLEVSVRYKILKNFVDGVR